MDAKFTLGKWRVDNGYVKDDAGYPVCQFFGASTYGSNWEANAKLTAAAPEMFGKLMETRLRIAEFTRHFKLHSEEYDELMAMAESINQLIKQQ